MDLVFPMGLALIRALAVLALPAEAQLQWLRAPGFLLPVDELALNLDAALVDQAERRGEVTAWEAAKIREIDALLKAMSGRENAPVWTEEALQSSPEWVRVRSLARQAFVGAAPDGSVLRTR